MVSCYDQNFGAGIQQEHQLNFCNVGDTYYIQVAENSAGSETFNVQVTTGANNGDMGCTCNNNAAIVNPGTCFTDDLSGAIGCLGSAGCQSGNNAYTAYTILPTTTSIGVSIDNVSSAFSGDIEVRIYSGGCSLALVSSDCGTVPYTNTFTGLTIGTKYYVFLSSSTNDNEVCDIFGVCIGDGGACSVGAGCGDTGGSANSYGIYSSSPITNADIIDCEITANAGCAGSGYLVYDDGGDNGYTQTEISSLPVITVSNISCRDADITYEKPGGFSDWSNLGSNSTATLPSSTNPITAQYTGGVLERKTIQFGSGGCTAAAASSNTTTAAFTDANNCGNEVTRTISISGYGANCKVNPGQITVEIDISHTWVEDVEVLLLTPGGEYLLLADDIGGSGDHFTNTIFSDNATSGITAGTPPFTGTFMPQGGATACQPTTVGSFGAINGGAPLIQTAHGHLYFGMMPNL